LPCFLFIFRRKKVVNCYLRILLGFTKVSIWSLVLECMHACPLQAVCKLRLGFQQIARVKPEFSECILINTIHKEERKKLFLILRTLNNVEVPRRGSTGNLDLLLGPQRFSERSPFWACFLRRRSEREC